MSGSKVKSITDRAIKVMNESPRIKFSHIKDNPGAKTQVKSSKFSLSFFYF